MRRKYSSPPTIGLENYSILLILVFLAGCSAAPIQDSTDIQQMSEGCYYNYNHYNEGDRILTNEPCLNCTCHNNMLMCYLRVCPFTKPIGHDCIIEKREDQCCPIITCPEVQVDVMMHKGQASTSAIGFAEKYGCVINNKFFPEGSQVPSNPNRPCELCYCIRNSTSCLMQECTLHIDGCQPIYHRGSCCPVRYNCDHDLPEIEDMTTTTTTTTVRPTEGFIMTTIGPDFSEQCMHNGDSYLDGSMIQTENPCDSCYCMKGKIVCAVRECTIPSEYIGRNCTANKISDTECCPQSFTCDNYGIDSTAIEQITTQQYEKATTVLPARIEPEISEEDEQLQKHIDDLEDGYIKPQTYKPVTDESVTFASRVDGVQDESTSQLPDRTVSMKEEKTESPFESVTEQTIEPEIKEKDQTTPDLMSVDDLKMKPTESIEHGVKEEKDKVSPVVDDIITEAAIVGSSDEEGKEGSTPVPIDSMASSTKSSLDEDKTSVRPSEDVEHEASVKPEEPVESSSVVPADTEENTTSAPTQRPHTEQQGDFKDQITEIPPLKTISTLAEDKTEVPISEITPTKSVEASEMTTASGEGEVADHSSESSMTTSEEDVTTEGIEMSIPFAIPGEGDCLLDKKTYKNNSTVPSTNECEYDCECVSSMIKCKTIQCPQMVSEDCTIEELAPGACCPTFSCPDTQEEMKKTELEDITKAPIETETKEPQIIPDLSGRFDIDSTEKIKEETTESAPVTEREKDAKKDDTAIGEMVIDQMTTSVEPESVSQSTTKSPVIHEITTPSLLEIKTLQPDTQVPEKSSTVESVSTAKEETTTTKSEPKEDIVTKQPEEVSFESVHTTTLSSMLVPEDGTLKPMLEEIPSDSHVMITAKPESEEATQIAISTERSEDEAKEKEKPEETTQLPIEIEPSTEKSIVTDSDKTEKPTVEELETKTPIEITTIKSIESESEKPLGDKTEKPEDKILGETEATIAGEETESPASVEISTEQPKYTPDSLEGRLDLSTPIPSSATTQKSDKPSEPEMEGSTEQTDIPSTDKLEEISKKPSETIDEKQKSTIVTELPEAITTKPSITEKDVTTTSSQIDSSAEPEIVKETKDEQQAETEVPMSATEIGEVATGTESPATSTQVPKTSDKSTEKPDDITDLQTKYPTDTSSTAHPEDELKITTEKATDHGDEKPVQIIPADELPESESKKTIEKTTEISSSAKDKKQPQDTQKEPIDVTERDDTSSTEKQKDLFDDKTEGIESIQESATEKSVEGSGEIEPIETTSKAHIVPSGEISDEEGSGSSAAPDLSTDYDIAKTEGAEEMQSSTSIPSIEGEGKIKTSEKDEDTTIKSTTDIAGESPKDELTVPSISDKDILSSTEFSKDDIQPSTSISDVPKTDEMLSTERPTEIESPEMELPGKDETTETTTKTESIIVSEGTEVPAVSPAVQPIETKDSIDTQTRQPGEFVNIVSETDVGKEPTEIPEELPEHKTDMVPETTESAKPTIIETEDDQLRADDKETGKPTDIPETIATKEPEQEGDASISEQIPTERQPEIESADHITEVTTKTVEDTTISTKPVEKDLEITILPSEDDVKFDDTKTEKTSDEEKEAMAGTTVKSTISETISPVDVSNVSEMVSTTSQATVEKKPDTVHTKEQGEIVTEASDIASDATPDLLTRIDDLPLDQQTEIPKTKDDSTEKLPISSTETEKPLTEVSTEKSSEELEKKDEEDKAKPQPSSLQTEKPSKEFGPVISDDHSKTEKPEESTTIGGSVTDDLKISTDKSEEEGKEEDEKLAAGEETTESQELSTKKPDDRLPSVNAEDEQMPTDLQIPTDKTKDKQDEEEEKLVEEGDNIPLQPSEQQTEKPLQGVAPGLAEDQTRTENPTESTSSYATEATEVQGSTHIPKGKEEGEEEATESHLTELPTEKPSEGFTPVIPEGSRTDKPDELTISTDKPKEQQEGDQDKQTDDEIIERQPSDLATKKPFEENLSVLPEDQTRTDKPDQTTDKPIYEDKSEPEPLELPTEKPLKEHIALLPEDQTKADETIESTTSYVTDLQGSTHKPKDDEEGDKKKPSDEQIERQEDKPLKEITPFSPEDQTRTDKPEESTASEGILPTDLQESTGMPKLKEEKLTEEESKTETQPSELSTEKPFEELVPVAPEVQDRTDKPEESTTDHSLLPADLLERTDITKEKDEESKPHVEEDKTEASELPTEKPLEGPVSPDDQTRTDKPEESTTSEGILPTDLQESTSMPKLKEEKPTEEESKTETQPLELSTEKPFEGLVPVVPEVQDRTDKPEESTTDHSLVPADLLERTDIPKEKEEEVSKPLAEDDKTEPSQSSTEKQLEGVLPISPKDQSRTEQPEKSTTAHGTAQADLQESTEKPADKEVKPTAEENKTEPQLSDLATEKPFEALVPVEDKTEVSELPTEKPLEGPVSPDDQTRTDKPEESTTSEGILPTDLQESTGMPKLKEEKPAEEESKTETQPSELSTKKPFEGLVPVVPEDHDRTDMPEESTTEHRLVPADLLERTDIPKEKDEESKPHAEEDKTEVSELPTEKPLESILPILPKDQTRTEQPEESTTAHGTAQADLQEYTEKPTDKEEKPTAEEDKTEPQPTVADKTERQPADLSTDKPLEEITPFSAENQTRTDKPEESTTSEEILPTDLQESTGMPKLKEEKPTEEESKTETQPSELSTEKPFEGLVPVVPGDHDRTDMLEESTTEHPLVPADLLERTDIPKEKDEEDKTEVSELPTEKPMEEIAPLSPHDQTKVDKPEESTTTHDTTPAESQEPIDEHKDEDESGKTKPTGEEDKTESQLSELSTEKPVEGLVPILPGDDTRTQKPQESTTSHDTIPDDLRESTDKPKDKDQKEEEKPIAEEHKTESQPSELQTEKPFEDVSPIIPEDRTKTEKPIDDTDRDITIRPDYVPTSKPEAESTQIPKESEISTKQPIDQSQTEKPVEEQSAEQHTISPLGGISTQTDKSENKTDKPTVVDDLTTTPTTKLPMPTKPTFMPSMPGYIPPDMPTEYYDEPDDADIFGPGTCRYGGKLFVSAQQIPRDDPCDFCFCFRSDIICLQQSCPPPISGCNEEPISGFCCPRYECPVSMGYSANSTTSTTTTTLPPHFLHRRHHLVERNGCQIQGVSYKVGDKIPSASGPCMQCTCGGDGQMECNPKPCTPEPMLRQMIAVVASRRRR